MAYPDEYMFYSNYYRGLLISSFQSLEKAIEYFIADYFIKDPAKSSELTSIILDRMTFEAKRTAYKAILIKTAESNGFVKTNKKGYIFKDHLDEISQLNSIRNMFAHYFPVIPGSNDGSVIALAEFRDNFSTKHYSKEDMDTIINRIHKTRDEVGKVI